jgi:hypothetical protein
VEEERRADRSGSIQLSHSLLLLLHSYFYLPYSSYSYSGSTLWTQIQTPQSSSAASPSSAPSTPVKLCIFPPVLLAFSR